MQIRCINFKIVIRYNDKISKIKKKKREKDKIQSKIINTTEIYRKVFNGSEQFYMHTK